MMALTSERKLEQSSAEEMAVRMEACLVLESVVGLEIS